MKIAELYFRMSVNMVKHERKVFQLMDWLAAVGGIDTLLLKFSVFLFSGFANFNSNFITIRQSLSGKEKTDQSEEGKFKIGLVRERDELAEKAKAEELSMTMLNKAKLYCILNYKHLRCCYNTD